MKKIFKKSLISLFICLPVLFLTYGNGWTGQKILTLPGINYYNIDDESHYDDNFP